MRDGRPSPALAGASDAGNARRPILLIAGFGDDASMFDGLSDTRLAGTHRLLPVDLPGFGAPPPGLDTTLASLARFVAGKAKESGAQIIVAHSVASIIASLAAQEPGCPITTILSLEGNITAEDAYFSGTAADYDCPDTFKAAFLERLDEMASGSPVVARYRDAAAKADSLTLWQLGTDARRFSEASVPGDILAAAADVTYFYNPENCPETTLRWLDRHPMDRIVLENASHWPSVDQPALLADGIAKALT